MSEAAVRGIHRCSDGYRSAHRNPGESGEKPWRCAMCPGQWTDEEMVDLDAAVPAIERRDPADLVELLDAVNELELDFHDTDADDDGSAVLGMSAGTLRKLRDAAQKCGVA
jgi:hypothetical protein